jgi:hypothetical protein
MAPTVIFLRVWELRKKTSGSTGLSSEKETLPGRQVEGRDAGKALEITVEREEVPAVARTVPEEVLVVRGEARVEVTALAVPEVAVEVAVPEAAVAVEGRGTPHVDAASIVTVARGAIRN